MKFWKIASVATALVFSSSVNAALVNVGYLTTQDDGSSNIITDTLNNVEYLRFDILAPLTYAETLAALSTQDGGGWSIASVSDAVSFSNAALNGTVSCSHDGIAVTQQFCGQMTNWYDGILGDNYNIAYDFVFFHDDNNNVDYFQFTDATNGGFITMKDLGAIATSDQLSGTDGPSVSWLVVRPAAVPVPPAVWLFGSGLISLIGIARRKKA